MGRTDNLLFRLHIDLPLLSGVLVMCALGLVVLYSASDQSVDVVLKQSVRILIGVAAMIAIAQISPRRLARWAPLVYSVGVVLLGLVLIVGTGRGAQRWLDLGLLRFQPSELMKLAVPLTVAAFMAEKVLPPNVRTAIVALVLVMLPVALIIEQPDLGTAVLVAASGLLVLFFAGVGWGLIRNGAIVALAAAPLVWFTMHDYQRRRVLTLFDPAQDPLGAGYHIIQSTIAVGSGGVDGKGWLNGTQSHLEFLPERATDFIFAVYCEEFGLVGVLVMLLGYGMIIIRGIQIALAAQEMFARLIAASVVLTLFTYIAVNMGMVIGQLPVVGVPLPMVSYGGTSLVTILIGFGILMSVQTHRRFIAVA